MSEPTGNAACSPGLDATAAVVKLIVWLCEEAQRKVAEGRYLNATSCLERAEQAVGLYARLVDEGAF